MFKVIGNYFKDLTVYYLQETHYNFVYADGVKVNGWKKIHYRILGLPKLGICSWRFLPLVQPLYGPIVTGAQGTGANADILVTATAVKKRDSFFSDPGVFCLLPAPMKLW